MTKKKGNRYSVSYRTLNDDKSCTLKLNSMIPLDESALEDFFLMGVECELSEIYKSLVGYYYENSSIKYRNISFIGSYNYGGKRLTTDRVIIKSVKKAFCDEAIMLNVMRDIFGSTFEFDAFSVLIR